MKSKRKLLNERLCKLRLLTDNKQDLAEKDLACLISQNAERLWEIYLSIYETESFSHWRHLTILQGIVKYQQSLWWFPR